MLEKTLFLEKGAPFQGCVMPSAIAVISNSIKDLALAVMGKLNTHFASTCVRKMAQNIIENEKANKEYFLRMQHIKEQILKV